MFFYKAHAVPSWHKTDNMLLLKMFFSSLLSTPRFIIKTQPISASACLICGNNNSQGLPQSMAAVSMARRGTFAIFFIKEFICARYITAER
jgi:hypothetical protein